MHNIYYKFSSLRIYYSSAALSVCDDYTAAAVFDLVNFSAFIL